MHEPPRPSYLKAFLTHPANTGTVLGVVALGVLGSFAMGFGAITLAAIAAASIEALGALFVPALPAFRASVDRAARLAARDEARRGYLAELEHMNARAVLDQFRAMDARVRQLHQAVAQRGATLGVAEVEKLEDLSVDFLGLAHLQLSMVRAKSGGAEAELTRRVTAIEAQLADRTRPEDEVRSLRAALTEYNESLARARRLAARRTSLEALLVSLPDKVEEVYQLVMSAPFSTDVGRKIEESLERLRIAEEVASEFDDTDWPAVAESTQSKTPASLAAARQARRVANSSSR